MKKTICSMLVLAGLCSCSGYLDTIPTTSVLPEEYLNGKDEAESMLMGIYSCFYDYSRIAPYIYDMMTDNIYTSNVSLGVNEFAAGTQNPLSTWTEYKWSNDYMAISRANFLIRQLAATDAVEKKDKAGITAEAKFLRAYFYFDLVQFYGRVPLLDENTPLKDMPREEIAKVLELVKSDIEFAVANLRYQKEPQCANVAAAWVLRLRVAQYENDNITVLDCCDAIDAMGFSLYPDYQKLFLEEGLDDPANEEVIWKINFDAEKHCNYASAIIYGWKSFHVTLEMVDSYFTANGLPIKKIVASDGTEIPGDPTYKPRIRCVENRDPRFYMSLLYFGQRYVYDAYSANYDVQPAVFRAYTGFVPRKHCNEHLAIEGKDGSDRILMRYGEVLLARAEAENELNGPAGAYDALDQLRSRVGMISVSESLPGLSQAAMRELIRNERRVELFLEGQRWSDIRRWKIAQDVMKDATGFDYSLLKYVDVSEQDWWRFKVWVADKRTFNEKKDYLWPIPQVEINANSCMTDDQNPGY